eukprot:GFKZ01008503.1.p1 GENE.GFKZ01008503.1~~GFKZ01008503.1.p1  ORF type:complete len:813 (+),score=65.76 GFKZ01008503.1:405-2843(+)
MFIHKRFIAWRRGKEGSQNQLQYANDPRSVLKVTIGLMNLYRTCNSRFRVQSITPRRCLTKPDKPVHNGGCDNQFHDYILRVDDILSDGQGSQFLVLDLLGTGTFGQVVKCRLQETGEIVAVKVVKNQPAYFNQAWVEINILRILHRNNGEEDTRHIVKFFTHFIFRGHLCLVFERLSVNLYEVLRRNNYVGVDLDTIRNYLTQLLKTLSVLVQSEVIHCDLKPENILLNGMNEHEVKIIDFGSACQLHYPVYSYVQSRFYRSPEVLLGASGYDSQIDMWSLGCVAGELFLGIPLFPGQNEMNMICRIVEMLGDMPDRFLRRCRETSRFFNTAGSADHDTDEMHVFRVKPVSQYEEENHTSLPEWRRFFKEKRLKDIVMTFPSPNRGRYRQETANRECFVDLLLGMLRIDPKERWTPAEALQHPFIHGQVLLSNQPWCPPDRQMRAMRSRPVMINPSKEGLTPVEEFYSASAPNFTAKGHLNVNTTWGTGAGGKPAIVNRGNGMFQFQQQYHLYSLDEHVGHLRNGQRSGVQGSPLTEERSLAHSSYVPISSLSKYGANSRFRHPSFENWTGNSTSVGSCSLVARETLIPKHDFAEAEDNSHASRGNKDSSPKVGKGESVFVSHPTANAFHFDSRQQYRRGVSTTQSRVMRDTLSTSQISPTGDVSEDAMFPFGHDDESGAPLHQGALSSAALNAYQHIHQNQPGYTLHQTVRRYGIRHSALPPTGPCMPNAGSKSTHGTVSSVPSHLLERNSSSLSRQLFTKDETLRGTAEMTRTIPGNGQDPVKDATCEVMGLFKDKEVKRKAEGGMDSN